ncbi:unnamed protein product [Durusdinium trenchii]|uniref:Uncharacterized protein n=2 Tax=Durusdinium trenchii TaxID=1381693 RepID=A0ABP0JGA0_9DINO
MVATARMRLKLLPCSMAFAVACHLLRHGLNNSEGFVGNNWFSCGRENPVALSAYKPILRRDPKLNVKLQAWIRQQLRLVKRQEAGGFSEPNERKRLYLKKLGLDKKADELEQQKLQPPWHLNHIVAGDKFVGYFQHPELFDGEQLDLTLEAVSESEGTMISKRGDFDETMKLEQDYPIAFQSGEQKDNDMAAYTFHKFNEGWRNFETPMPSEADCQHLTLPMLRLFFKQVADVEGFPSESEFAESCTDASKGMTREEFLTYLRAESPDYLEKSFKGIFTGRRLRLRDETLDFDGDFQSDAKNLIYGFVSFNGKPGGTFNLELTKEKK